MDIEFTSVIINLIKKYKLGINKVCIQTFTPSFMSLKGERKLEMSFQDILRKRG